MAILIVIDVQTNFCDQGEFPVTHGNNVAYFVRRLLDGAGHMYEHVFFTKDLLGKEFHPRIAGWILESFLDDRYRAGKVGREYIDVIDRKDIVEKLSHYPAQEVHLCGIPYDTSVRIAAEEVLNSFPDNKLVIFKEKCTAAARSQSARAATNELKYRGAILL